MEEMMRDPNCAYCMQGDLVAKFAYPVGPKMCIRDRNNGYR